MTDRGIEIPREIADAEGVPEDLDANIVGPYRFPSPRRRRAAAYVYLAAGAITAALAISDAIPAGMWWVAVAFALFGLYHFAAATDTRLSESDALATAGRLVPFTIGHASAALRFEGLRAYPVWNVLVYDAEDPPTRRALVYVDAVTGAERRPAYEDEVPEAG